MSEESVVVICVVVPVILFHGEPDLIDALIARLGHTECLP